MATMTRPTELVAAHGASEAEPKPIPDAEMHIPYTLFTKGEKRCIVALITFAGWFSTVSSFIYYPAMSMVARDLDTTIGLVNLTVTSYLVASGIAPSILGDAADTFERRPVYFVTLALY
ncbi:Major facilitator superfamily transporter [Metarhizium guizhouense ARSEF 977]|uniref:Major facilitator superfamily transporter n=1 Tax=Metarhizium guizhouense (strain ARSEF 977) TaxID=1276136 RepID=A0A0B4G6D8_METGA|nr:Major facilitator superfamily transporter [Metarhizium guizhouense ARSEF 977]